MDGAGGALDSESYFIIQQFQNGQLLSDATCYESTNVWKQAPTRAR